MERKNFSFFSKLLVFGLVCFGLVGYGLNGNATLSSLKKDCGDDVFRFQFWDSAFFIFPERVAYSNAENNKILKFICFKINTQFHSNKYNHSGIDRQSTISSPWIPEPHRQTCPRYQIWNHERKEKYEKVSSF